MVESTPKIDKNKIILQRSVLSVNSILFDNKNVELYSIYEIINNEIEFISDMNLQQYKKITVDYDEL